MILNLQSGKASAHAAQQGPLLALPASGALNNKQTHGFLLARRQRLIPALGRQTVRFILRFSSWPASAPQLAAIPLATKTTGTPTGAASSTQPRKGLEGKWA